MIADFVDLSIYCKVVAASLNWDLYAGINAIDP